MKNIKTALEMWGNWARCSTGTDWQGVSVGFEQMISPPRPMGIRCDDSEGELVDSSVAELRNFDSLAYQIVIAHYVYHISQAKIGKVLDKAQSYIAVILRVAEAFIAGQLFGRSGEVYALS